MSYTLIAMHSQHLDAVIYESAPTLDDAIETLRTRLHLEPKHVEALRNGERLEALDELYHGASTARIVP